MTLAAALLALGVLAGVVSTAAAQSQTSDLSITHAEFTGETGVIDEIIVGGTGRCESTGTVIVSVRMTDLDTGATTAFQWNAVSECVSPGEHIIWQDTVNEFQFPAQFRPGDRVLIDASAVGAIDASTSRELVLKKQS